MHLKIVKVNYTCLTQMNIMNRDGIYPVSFFYCVDGIPSAGIRLIRLVSVWAEM
jgi:hypothetical protein